LSPLRILVVDDHEPVRRSLRFLLSSRADWSVCGEAEDGPEAVEKAIALRPDVVLMDVSMPRMNGLDATRIIRRELPESKVVIVSQNDPVVARRQAQQVDAAAFVAKSDIVQDLLPTLDRLVSTQGARFSQNPLLPNRDESGAESAMPQKGDPGYDLIQDVEVSAEELRRVALPEATDLLAAIVDSSDDAIISKNLDGVITSWNKSAERLFGYTAQEAIGRRITLIVPLDRRREEMTILDRLRRGERIDHFETVRVRKDGTTVDISLTVSPVKDAGGRVVGASKVARNISERKVADQALAERALLLDLSNDAIFVRDEADRITYWNKSAYRLYGYSPEEAVGRVSHDLLHTEFPEPLERIFEQLRRDNRWAGELTHRRKDGSQIVVASRWVLDRDDRGNHKRVLETNNDISQQKRDEKALRESEERLRTLADGLEAQVRVRTQELELRNAEVLQQAEQLRELSNSLQQTQDQERRHIARELHDSAGQIVTALGMNLAGVMQHAKQNPLLGNAVQDSQRLVQQLSKEIRTMSYLLHPPLLDDSGLSEAIRWYAQGLTERSGLNTEIHISEDFGRLPSEFELAVFRIVQECLTNIHRHSGSKTAAIRLSREAQSVSLEIHDDGKGISPEKLAAIQAHRSGVGIMGMRERVRHFDGVLDIHSDGSGTTIFVTFPIPLPTALQPTLTAG
jgi:PAS domain S-box-containing protein